MMFSIFLRWSGALLHWFELFVDMLFVYRYGILNPFEIQVAICHR